MCNSVSMTHVCGIKPYFITNDTNYLYYSIHLFFCEFIIFIQRDFLIKFLRDIPY